MVLNHRLDGERHVRERAQVGRELHVLGIDLSLQAAQRLLDGCPGSFGRAVRASQQQYWIPPTLVVGGGCGESAGDRAAAGYSDAFVQDGAPAWGFGLRGSG